MISEPEMLLIGFAAALGLLALFFWVAMIRDCWITTLPGSTERWVWLLVIVLGKLAGAGAYYLLKKRPLDLAAASAAPGGEAGA